MVSPHETNTRHVTCPHIGQPGLRRVGVPCYRAGNVQASARGAVRMVRESTPRTFRRTIACRSARVHRRANQSDRFFDRVNAMKQGKRSLRTTTLPLSPKSLNGRAVKRVRASLHASQAVFARFLNVSAKLVHAWEANRRTPEGPALVLLHIAARQRTSSRACGRTRQRIGRAHHDAGMSEHTRSPPSFAVAICWSAVWL